jgi:hypothetical protein
MLIVTGDQELAAAYVVHVPDVYDHYRFRAIASERKRKGQKGWSGFLDTNDGWQNGYVEGRKRRSHALLRAVSSSWADGSRSSCG